MITMNNKSMNNLNLKDIYRYTYRCSVCRKLFGSDREESRWNDQLLCPKHDPKMLNHPLYGSLIKRKLGILTTE